jgi:4-amino-4-deoxy-L-arabinose transferase-like glycosyltransferase
VTLLPHRVTLFGRHVTLPVTPRSYAEGMVTATPLPTTAPPAERATRNAERGTLFVLAFTLVAYLALAIGYATLTPIWQNPDEPAHFTYIAFVARTGGLPELTAGDWDSALLERLKNGRLQPGDSVDAIRYEAWQPPLFYLLAAPLVRIGPLDDPAALVPRVRGFDIVLGALTLGVAYAAGREILNRQQAVAVPLAMVGIPMFTAVSAAISADPLANLLSAAIVLVLLRALLQGINRSRWPLGVGVLLGLGLLTKLALAIFVPLALIVVLVRSAKKLRDCGVLIGSAMVVVLPWTVHQVTTYGWADPLATSRHAAVVLDQPRFPGLSPEYVANFLTISFHSFWAQFGWMGVVAPDRLYLTYGLATLVALAGLVLQRRRLGEPAYVLLLATLAAAMLAYVGYNLTFEQPQGRYLFTALVPLCVLLVVGWSAWLPERTPAWAGLAIPLVLVGLNTYALLRVLVPGFAPPG